MKKITLRSLLLMGLLSLGILGKSQEIVDPCGNDAWHISHLTHDPAYRESIEKADNIAREWLQKNPHHLKDNSGKKMVIPVVFHVVWNTQTQMLAYERMVQEIEVLNRDYNRFNRDRFKTRPIFDSIAGSVDVVFQLANLDPSGNQTNGVTYTYTSFLGFDLSPRSANYAPLDSLKSTNGGGHDAWPTDQYLNLWVARLTYFGSEGLYGIATFPRSMPAAEEAGNLPSPAKLEGACLFYQTIGMNISSTGDTTFAGRTASHEIGHYMGLRHIWGDSQSQQCDSSDYVDDTPQDKKNANFTCNLTLNECSNENPYWGTTNPPNMVENFMDYSGDLCYNMFSNGQISRMHSYLNTDRKNLWSGNTAGGKDPSQFKAWGYTDAVKSCPTTACDGAIQIAALEGTRPYTYYVDGQSSPDSSFTAQCSGIHNVVVKDATGDSIYFDVYVSNGPYRKPTYAKSTSAASCFACPDGKAKITINTGTNPVTVTWDVNPPVIAPELTGCSNGYYRFTLTDGCGQSYTDSVKVGSPTGIEALTASDLILFPNPAHSKVTIQLPQAIEMKEVILRNVIGAKLRNVTINRNTSELEIPVEDLPSGIYILELVDHNNGSKSMKFVKEN